jgi:hypothetical protein
MTPSYLRRHVVPAALVLLPPGMTSPQAEALLVAIALQESRIRARRQAGGPARSYWQFETGGVSGVLSHPSTFATSRQVLAALDYPSTLSAALVLAALEHHDVLACAFARLLLWTLPGSLPGRDDPQAGWQTYLQAWRPGKPRPESWLDAWRTAWA